MHAGPLAAKAQAVEFGRQQAILVDEACVGVATIGALKAASNDGLMA